MLKVAIVDDDSTIRKRIDEIVKQYMDAITEPCQIREYGGTENLMLDLEQGAYFDLFLLDVEMPNMTGLDMARAIRRYYPDPAIIYITNHMQYAYEAFEVNAFRYISKDRLEEKLREALELVIPRVQEQEKSCYIIRYYQDIQVLLLRDIYYMEKKGKYVIFHHSRGESRDRKTLKEVLKEIASEDFIEVGRDYAVNVRHLIAVENRELILRGNLVLPVSRYRVEALREKMMEYWGQKV